MLTHQRLQELLSYNPETGKFYWRVSRGCQKAYAEAGVQDGKGYLVIKIDKIRYGAHRLAVMYMTGAFPESDVDHINRIKNDNRWCNLRPATRSQNQNNSKVYSTNALGIKNIRKLPDTGKFQVRIKRKSYGCFDKLEDAVQVAVNVRNKLYGEFARHE